MYLSDCDNTIIMRTLAIKAEIALTGYVKQLAQIVPIRLQNYREEKLRT